MCVVIKGFTVYLSLKDFIKITRLLLAAASINGLKKYIGIFTALKKTTRNL